MFLAFVALVEGSQSRVVLVDQDLGAEVPGDLPAPTVNGSVIAVSSDVELGSRAVVFGGRR